MHMPMVTPSSLLELFFCPATLSMFLVPFFSRRIGARTPKASTLPLCGQKLPEVVGKELSG